MTARIVLLPEPDGPNSAVIPAGTEKAASSRKAGNVVAGGDVEHGHPSSRCMRRAMSSESSSRAIASPTEMAERRAATASPPGTWVAA